jgi:phosphatidylglycerophosphate synthase
MKSVPWRLPAPPLRGRVIVATAVGCVGAAGLGVLAQWSIAGVWFQPLVAAAVFAAIMSIAIASMGDHHPFRRFGPANHVTLVRGMLLAVAASTIVGPAGPAAAWAVVSATAVFAALDGLDGWIARRTRMASAFGARFDMELDALFILVLSVLVWQHQKAGMWVLAAGIMRYAFVAAGWVLPWLSRPLRATRRGKAAAVAQFVGLAVALAPIVPVPLSRGVAAAAVSALAWSFAIDVRFLWRNRPGVRATASDGDSPA